MYTLKQFSKTERPAGISEKALTIHQDKLYAGYVAKKNEIEEKLKTVDVSSANLTYSELRALKDGETFAVNGVYLHEYYFEVLGGAGGTPSGTLLSAIEAEYGSFEKFIAMMSACGMAARGWVVFAYDTMSKKLAIYTADAHNQGGVWGAIPLLVLDVYEHAYFMDYGSDRKQYITDFFANVNWEMVSERFSPLS